MAKHTFEYDDETRQITAPGYKVSEIWDVIAGELARQKRWHATRDAVLGGLCASGLLEREHEMKQLRGWAATAADEAHGPLEAKKEA